MYRGGLLEADHSPSFVRARVVVQWFTDAVGAVETRDHVVCLSDLVSHPRATVWFGFSFRGEILTFPDTLTTQGLSLWSLNIVGGEILTFPDTLTTQGLSLWSLNIVSLDVFEFRLSAV